MERTWVAWRSLFLINLAAVMERADEGLLPAVYREIGNAFHASPSQLGTLTFIRAVVQAVSSPFAGFLALHYDRASVIGLGTLFWAFSTAAVGLSQTYLQCAIWRAINGVGLAIVIPALQSFIADSYPEESRGMAFGFLNLVGSFGSIIGSMSATMLAGYDTFIFISGWRFSFLLMCVISCIIGLLVLFFVMDPKSHPSNQFLSSFSSSSSSSHKISSQVKSKSDLSVFQFLATFQSDMWYAVKEVLHVRTFQIIVAQGIVGSLPWQAMVFFTLWLQLIGFSHNESAILVGLFSLGCAFGALLGGYLGDLSSQLYPAGGRIMCAQFSALTGIFFSLSLFLFLPLDTRYLFAFAFVFVMGGLTVSWGQACNNPLFAEVVPNHLRTCVYAFDRAFEGLVSSIAAPAVGIFAEKFFGYHAGEGGLSGKDGKQGEGLGGRSVENARALGYGLLSSMAVPFAVCCMVYGGLYWCYERDKEMARRKDLEYVLGEGKEEEKGVEEGRFADKLSVEMAPLFKQSGFIRRTSKLI